MIVPDSGSVYHYFTEYIQTMEVYTIILPNTTTTFQYSSIFVFPLCVTAQILTLNMLIPVFGSCNIQHDGAAK